MHDWLVVSAIIAVLNVLSQEKIPLVFRWLTSPLLVYLGKISYSFFVIQIPLSILLDALIARGRISPTNMLVLPISFVISVVGGIILHVLVEEPTHKWVANRLRIRAEAKTLVSAG